MNRKSYNHIFLILSLVTVCVFAAYLFSIWFVKHTTERASHIENEIETINEQQMSLESLRHILSDTETDRKILSNYYVKNDIVPFLETVENLGRDTGIEMSIFNVSVLPSLLQEEETERLVVEMDVAGSWRNVFSFLARLETLPQGVLTQKVSISFVPSDEISSDDVYYPWIGQITISVWKLK